MPSIRLEELSSFGRSALKLDRGFSELARLGEQIERLNLESDHDLDHALKLLKKFSLQGQAIAEDMQEFSRSLQEARERSEAAAGAVGERAKLLQERRTRRAELQERLLRVEQDIQAANAGLVGERRGEKSVLPEENKSRVKTRFSELHQKLADFIQTAQTIKKEAAQLKFKRIQRDAQSMLDHLQTLRGKLQTLLS